MTWDVHSQGRWSSVSLKCITAHIRSSWSQASVLPLGWRRLHRDVTALSQKHHSVGIRASFLREERAGIATSKSWKLPGGWLPNTIHWSLGSRVHWGTMPICLLIFVFIFHNKMLNMNYGYSALNCNKSWIFHLLGYSSLSDTLYCLPEYFYKVFASFNL